MFNFITGYVIYSVKTHNANTLINRLRHEIPIYGIRLNASMGLTFTTGYRYKSSAENAISDLNCEILSSQSFGVPALADRYKKRVGIWIGLILSIIMLVVFSNIIWDIRIYGNDIVSDETVIRLLDTLGISEGKFINKKELEKIYNNFLIKEHRISWISVNFDGTVAKVEVDETKKIPVRVDRNKPLNVVAKCDGIIKRIDVFDGTCEIDKEATVTKGQLLISSFTETRASGTFLKTARGNAWAVTIHSYDIHIPKASNVIKNSDYKRKYGILVLGQRIPLYIDEDISNECSNINYAQKRAVVFNNIKLPFRFSCEQIETSEVSTVNCDEISAKKKAESELDKRIATELNEAEIIKVAESYADNETEYIFSYELTCIENIAETVEIILN